MRGGVSLRLSTGGSTRSLLGASRGLPRLDSSSRFRGRLDGAGASSLLTVRVLAFGAPPRLYGVCCYWRTEDRAVYLFGSVLWLYLGVYRFGVGVMCGGVMCGGVRRVWCLCVYVPTTTNPALVRGSCLFCDALLCGVLLLLCRPSPRLAALAFGCCVLFRG